MQQLGEHRRASHAHRLVGLAAPSQTIASRSLCTSTQVRNPDQCRRRTRPDRPLRQPDVAGVIRRGVVGVAGEQVAEERGWVSGASATRGNLVCNSGGEPGLCQTTLT